MFTVILPMIVVVVISTVAMIALNATITKAENLQPVTVDAFNFPARSLSSADTISASAPTAQTTFNQQSDWQTVTVHHLGDVTDLLDYLENHGVQTREVVTLDNNCFAVRWK
jgi:hypothetical protein